MELTEHGKIDFTLRDEAVKQVKELAQYYSIPEDKLNLVLIKGLQLLSEIKAAGVKSVIVEDKFGKRERIDLTSI